MRTRFLITLLAAASATALTACKLDYHPPAPAAAAPAVRAALPGPGPLGATQVAFGPQSAPNSECYAPAERAHSFDRAIYRRAPNYRFRYQGGAPLAWRNADGYSMYAERVDTGYRRYYFAPGASRPYFVRDPRYGYGYGPDGALLALYDAAGALLGNGGYGQVGGDAAGYYIRAQNLHRYGVDDSYRMAVSQSDWSQLGPAFYAAQNLWISAPDRQPQWRAWRTFHSRDLATYDVAPYHDNGRHLGWYKHDRFASARRWLGERNDEKGFKHQAKFEEKAFKHGGPGGGHGHGDGGESDNGHGEGHGHGKD